MSTPVPVEEDEDVRAALDWFHAIAGPELVTRVRIAQAHFRQATSNPSDRATQAEWAKRSFMDDWVAYMNDPDGRSELTDGPVPLAEQPSDG